MDRLHPGTGRTARNAALLLAAVVVIGAGLMQARALVVPLLLAGFIAAVTAPLVLWLRDRRVPAALAVTAGLLVDVLALVVFGGLLGAALTGLTGRLPLYQERFGELMANVVTWLTAQGVEVSAKSAAEMADPAVLLDMVGKLLQSVAAMVSRIFLVMVVVAFLLVEATTFRHKVREILGKRDLEALREAGSEVNSYLLVKTGTSLLTGVVVGVWCQLLHVDLPVLWGVLAFLLNYIPTVGSIIAAIPPVLLALVMQGTGTALVVGAGYLVINVSIASFIEPRLMGRALGLSPLVVFLSMVLWYWLLGPVGALFSGPLTMLVKTWLEFTDDLAWVAVLLGPAPSSRAGPVPEDATDPTEARATS